MQCSRLVLLALAGMSFLLSQTTNGQSQGAPLQLGPRQGSPAAKAITAAAPPARVASVDAAEAVRKANAYFGKINTFAADFVQTGGDGRRAPGKLYVQKPGKLRFEYAKPSPLEIIADGTSVAIRNRRLNTQDLYYISQTPLKFLLKGNIDLARDTKILDVTSDAETTSIRIEDRATLGGTSRITLIFANADFSLRKWVVNDPQGNETLVTLSNLDLQARPESGLFRINYERQD